MRLTSQQLAIASQGEWLSGKQEPVLIDGICTDSREFIAGHAFLALRGVTFDGHTHAAQVAHKASALIGDQQGATLWQDLTTPQLQVNDTLQALGDIAAYHRKQLTNTRVVAITGSYGKTTVRSMLQHVLSQSGVKVAATKANFNNLIGVPKTLLAIDAEADVAVIECGISELGEMQRIAAMVQPDVVILTGFTAAHSQGLGGLTGVVKEKFELVKHLQQDGFSVLGKGVAKHLVEAGCVMSLPTFGLDEADAVSWQLTGQDVLFSLQDEQASLKLSLPAEHWAEDMALVITVVKQLVPSLNVARIVSALQTWQAVDGRLQVFAASKAQPFALIDDSYNANPASMQAGLDTLAKMAGKRIAIIADMLELGENAKSAHAALQLHDIDQVLCVGELMGELARGKSGHHVQYFERLPALMHWLKQHHFPTQDSTVLIKGSHSMGLAQVVDFLRNRGAHAL
ncbi:MAG: hypothetical protein AUK35_03175 [Zetaproteobacteria bacterium CG2_30_46_52]|nr:MAG: hypothetical protein AUK35_03175 [Zetaproteobacteria bacterium CG2_30_46_52]